MVRKSSFPPLLPLPAFTRQNWVGRVLAEGRGFAIPLRTNPPRCHDNHRYEALKLTPLRGKVAPDRRSEARYTNIIRVEPPQPC
ncbi:MAG: hypothetical protein ICV78_02985 [Tolypothrix sp. Co-bin9]|nr:hypothetical protein [Tolypothrix sp. Co-bin9]